MAKIAKFGSVGIEMIDERNVLRELLMAAHHVLRKRALIRFFRHDSCVGQERSRCFIYMHIQVEKACSLCFEKADS